VPPFFLLWPWPWPDDLDIRTWHIYPDDVPAYQNWTFWDWSMLSKVRARTGQTDRQTQPNALPLPQSRLVKTQAEKAKKFRPINPSPPLNKVSPAMRVVCGLWTLLLMEDRNFRASAHLYFRCFHIIAVDNWYSYIPSDVISLYRIHWGAHCITSDGPDIRIRPNDVIRYSGVLTL